MDARAGGSGVLRRSKSDLGHEVSHPYAAWKRSAERTSFSRKGRDVAKMVESSMASTMVIGKRM
jgi:hypothetical protein